MASVDYGAATPTKRQKRIDPLTGQPVADPAAAGVDYAAPAPAVPMTTQPTTVDYAPGPTANIEGPTEDGNDPIPPVPGVPFNPVDPAPPDAEEPPPPVPSTDGTNWATADYSNPATVEAYFRSRGVTPRPGSAEYWASKYNSPEFNGDREYFFRRLSTAEEFGGGGAGAGGGYAENPSSPFNDEIRQILLDRIAKDSGPFDPNSPEIEIPMTGARLENSRSQEAERRALGERLFAGGDTTSSTGGQMVQQSAERGAAALGTMRGTLISKEINARRENLTNMLQMAIASGDADMARRVQIALANLGALVQREGYGIDLARIKAQQDAAAVAAGKGNQ